MIQAPNRSESLASPAASTFALLVAELSRIERHLREVEAEQEDAISKVDALWTDSARNLVHYVGLRQTDLRELQVMLQECGLSSLGRSESFVMGSLLEVLARAEEALFAHGGVVPVARLAVRGKTKSNRGQSAGSARLDGTLRWETAKHLLHWHTREALGPCPVGRHVYVMVTAPSASEADAAWCERMLRAGMNLLRINSAHEDEAAWQKVLDALHAALKSTGLACSVLMDLAGPKIRTGSIEASRRVVTWKLRRDDCGRVVAPTRIPLLAHAGLSEPIDGTAVVLSDADFTHLASGDVLSFRDARGRKCKLRVAASGDGFVGETKRKAWIVPNTKAHLRNNDEMHGGIAVRLDPAPPRDPFIDLAAGDLLIISKKAAMGKAAKRGARGRVTEPARVGCTLPEALDNVAVGHRVLLDDGKFEGVVEKIAKQGDLTIRIRRAPPGGGKLRAEKGLNFPDSVLALPSLTQADRRILPFVTAHADLVGMSFVQTPKDVLDLHAELEKLGCQKIGVALKIETKTGFENLPRLLLTGMRRPPLSIMIARGDLAVEVGFERLAEVQAEILWHCEAAHVPAIWATQVLDTMARTGVPSRVEITDAASSVGAECVMLNKGPYMAEAIRTLVDILGRMEGHRYKKRDILRRLHVSTFT